MSTPNLEGYEIVKTIYLCGCEINIECLNVYCELATQLFELRQHDKSGWIDKSIYKHFAIQTPSLLLRKIKEDN